MHVYNVYYTCPVHVGQLTQQILDMTPNKRDLLELLAEIKHMWYPVGEMLGVGRADLEGLHSSNRPDNETVSHSPVLDGYQTITSYLGHYTEGTAL